MTSVYLTTAAADAAVTVGSGTKWKAGWMAGASSTLINKNSVVGPTAPLQMTDSSTAGTDGTAVSWFTEPLWGVVIAGQITCLVWTKENATANNIAPTIRIERCDGAGNVLSTIVAETTSHGASEVGTTAGGSSDTITCSAANVTDTTLSDGDRLRITLWIDDAAGQGGSGSMASGGHGQFWVNGPVGAAGQAQISFTEVVAPQAGPNILPFETANWTATTTPRTITAVGALSADLIVAMFGGDNFGSQVTAASTSTTGGTTGAWTETQENFGPSSNSAWKSNAYASVTANGDVTVSLARTQGSPQVWGGWAALLKNHGGIGNVAQLTNGATETVSLTTSAGSIVLALGIDWDDLTNVAFLPAGAHDVERSSGTALAWYAGFWVGQAAGTRNYGIATSSTANFVLTLIEIKAPTGLSAALATVSETDTAIAIAAKSKKLLSPVTSEADTAKAFAAITKKLLSPIATETDTAITIAGRSKKTLSPVATETDSAITLGRTSRLTVPISAETDAAQTLSRKKSRLLGITAETDSAVTVVRQAQFTFATETDLAVALGRISRLTIPTSAETDVARTLTGVRSRLVSIATEADTARATGGVSLRAMPIALETSLALALGRTSTLLLPKAAETDSAQILGIMKRRGLPLATESDSARTITRLKVRILGTSTEVDAALIVGRRKTQIFVTAVEIDTALEIASGPLVTIDISVLVGSTRKRELVLVGTTRVDWDIDDTRGSTDADETRERDLLIIGNSRDRGMLTAGSTRQDWIVGSTRGSTDVEQTVKERD